MNIYEVVTNRILEEMRSNKVAPWHRPWHGVNDMAISYTTRKPYSLLNQLLLGKSGEWLTFNEVKSLGGKIKKGAKAGMVTFFKPVPKKVQETDGVVVDEENEEKVRMTFILRYYNVFHIDDCEGIKSKIKAGETPAAINPIEGAERYINAYLEREKHLRFESKLSNKAYYSPLLDNVVVPIIGQFDQAEAYYATAFHELVHSTGHESRLDRKAGMKAIFGNVEYSKEELVAEIGSAMILNTLGFETEKTFNNSVAYIQNWIEVLQNDPRMIVFAASGAEKAVSYFLNESSVVC